MSIPESIAHYRILRKLSSGGMGDVYLAEDTKLERRVAIKLLHSYAAEGSQGQARLVKEAQSAARLDHPNVCAIYEVGESTSGPYIAMQYLEGEPLSAVFKRTRPDSRTLLTWGLQVAEALQEAHSHGIIHRDIKPANLMLTSKGHVKVLDFGLAKSMGPARPVGEHSLGLTTPGMVMGTVPYMSPEQVRGEPLDGRTDLFSLGGVLFEAAVGRRPFGSENPADLMSEILMKDPFQDLGETPLSPELEHLLRGLLEKDRTKRVPSAEVLVAELRRVLDPGRSGTATASHWPPSGRTHPAGIPSGDLPTHAVPTHTWAPPTPRRWRPWLLAGLVAAAVAVPVGLYAVPRLLARQRGIDSIAVLPFVNGSGDPEREYLSEGLTENLINQLSRMPNLKVIARSSMLRYKGREPDPATLMRDLDVKAVLSGRFVQRGNEVTFSLELADLRDNRRVWGEKYTRTIPELLDLQDRIAQDVVQGLGRELGKRERLALGQGGIHTNPEAYQLYLKGRFLADQWTPESTDRILGYFDQALKVDPNFALAHVGKAYFYWGLSTTFRPSGEMMGKVLDEAQKALDLDPNLAEAYAARALAELILSYDTAASERDLRRAVELNPGSASVHQTHAYLLMVLGRRAEAMEALKQAQELDPVSSTTLTYVANAHRWFGEPKATIEASRKLVEMEPEFWWGHQMLGRAFLDEGRLEAALEEINKGAASGSPYALACKGYILARMGRAKECRSILEDMLGPRSSRGYISPYFFGILYSGLRDAKSTKLWLSRARDAHEESILFLGKDPVFQWLGEDPEFRRILPPLPGQGPT